MPRDSQRSPQDVVTVSDWNACFNSSDNTLVLSCTVTAVEPNSAISGVGLILNDSHGATLASVYTGMSGGNQLVYPAINLPPGNLSVGDTVNAVAQGECNGHHFFFEQELSITNC